MIMDDDDGKRIFFVVDAIGRLVGWLAHDNNNNIDQARNEKKNSGFFLIDELDIMEFVVVVVILYILFLFCFELNFQIFIINVKSLANLT